MHEWPPTCWPPLTPARPFFTFSFSPVPGAPLLMCDVMVYVCVCVRVCVWCGACPPPPPFLLVNKNKRLESVVVERAKKQACVRAGGAACAPGDMRVWVCGERCVCAGFKTNGGGGGWRENLWSRDERKKQNQNPLIASSLCRSSPFSCPRALNSHVQNSRRSLSSLRLHFPPGQTQKSHGQRDGRDTLHVSSFRSLSSFISFISFHFHSTKNTRARPSAAPVTRPPRASVACKVHATLSLITSPGRTAGMPGG